MSHRGAIWRALAGGLLALGVATPAWSAQWTVDMAKSRLGFTVQWGEEPFTAHFASWSATIQFDPAYLAHGLTDVTIDLASETSDAPDLDDDIKSGLGFAAAQFPRARFVTTGFVHKGGDDYAASGQLSLRGVTRDVSVPFTLTFDGDHAHMKGRVDLDRMDFGIGRDAPAAPVAHTVTVTIDLYATRAAP